MKIKNVLLVGLGAIGSAYAELLNENIPDHFRVLADEKRIEKLKDGLIINDRNCKFSFVKPSEKAYQADLILFTTKFCDFEQAMDDVANLVSDNTIFLSLLNGISTEKMLAKRFGREKIICGKSFGLGATKKGNIVTFPSIGSIVMGDFEENQDADCLTAVQTLLQNAGIPVVISADIQRDLWWKLMVNCGSNQMSALMDATYGDFQQNPYLLNLTKDVMREVIALAQAQKIQLDERDIDIWAEMVMQYEKNGETSMLQDIRAKRKSEVELFGKCIVETAQQYHIPVPLNKMLCEAIWSIEYKNGLLQKKE